MEDSGGKGIKRRYKVIGIVILVLIGLFVGLNFWQDSELENRFDEIRADGFPVTLQELNDWYSIPEGAENAADIYIAAFEVYIRPKKPDTLTFFGRLKFPKPNEKLSAETTELIRQYLTDNEETLGLLYEAAKVKDCRYPIDYLWGVSALIAHLSENNYCTRLICLKAMLETESGKKEQVVEDIEAAVALGRSLENELLLISHLVRNSCLSKIVRTSEYAVNRVEFSDEQLVRMIDQFSEAENPDLMLNAVAGERCQIIDYTLYPSDHTKVSDLSPVVLRLYSASGMNKSGLLEYLDYFDGILSALRLPEHERVAALEPIDDQMGKLPWFHAVVKEIYFKASSICKLDLRGIAYLRVGRVGLAVERYRLAEGELPETLDEIAPRFIDSIPLDPFDGKPLRYKKLDKGYVVYSVGKDGVDNGGKERTKENRKKEHDVTFTVERGSGD